MNRYLANELYNGTRSPHKTNNLTFGNVEITESRHQFMGAATNISKDLFIFTEETPTRISQIKINAIRIASDYLH